MNVARRARLRVGSANAHPSGLLILMSVKRSVPKSYKGNDGLFNVNNSFSSRF